MNCIENRENLTLWVENALVRITEIKDFSGRTGSERPRKTTKFDDLITEKINMRPWLKTMPDITAEINQSLPNPISETTVMRRLPKICLWSRVTAKKPLLRKANIHKWHKRTKERVSWLSEQK